MTPQVPNADKLLVVVTHFYLRSNDFNGISAQQLSTVFATTWENLYEPLCHLIEDERAGILYADTALNSHIIRLGFEPKEVQIRKLKSADLHHTCVYPRPAHLSTVVKPTDYASKPYCLALALGEPQLAFRAFDLSVLEMYRNDPRYYYSTSDIGGKICIKTEAYESSDFPESDKVLLETFGFAYDDDNNRAVAAYLRYLANLTPEHQQIWKARELKAQHKLHPDYFRTTIVGDWPQGRSIFAAFLAKLQIINCVAAAMQRPNLFREDYKESKEEKPRDFAFLIRPTLREFNDFVHTLDKLISENINREFFQDDVNFETETIRNDGKIVVRPKGTLQALEEWLGRFGGTAGSRAAEIVGPFREVRNLRRRPAHALDENVFDQKYVKEQRSLMSKVYRAMETLEVVMSHHPAVIGKQIDVPRWMQEGRVWMM